MKLRAKLLLTILVATCLIILFIVILPYFLVKKTVAQSKKSTELLLDEQEKEALFSQFQWFSAEIELRKSVMEASLAHLRQESKNNTLLFSPSMSKEEKWNLLAKFFVQNPPISIVQLYSNQETERLTFLDAYLHQGILISFANQLLVITENNQNYLAIPLQDGDNVRTGFYALLENELSEKEQDLLFHELKILNFEEKSLEKTGKIKGNKNVLIEKLTFLYSKGAVYKQENKSRTLKGLFHLEEGNNGVFILTEQLYATAPLKAVNNLENNSLSEKGLIVSDSNETLYLLYSTLIDHTMISVGSELNSLLQEFAVASHSIVLLKSQDNWIGYDKNGKKLAEQYVQNISRELRSENEGSFIWETEPYHYFKLTEQEDPHFHLVVVFPTKRVVLQILYRLENALSTKLLQQMIVVASIIFLILLVFFWHFSNSFVKPILELAHATSFLGKGNFKGLVLPKLENRKDEVADLARGFEDMVIQLRDREKVRGVLNKVVSKEIADEILKGQVQLGGEDRIVTMLFCDVRDFTMQTSNLPPQDTIRLLNFYMTRISEIIEGEGGLIDKYIGDEVMALYGAPVPCENHAMRAISSGMLIIKTLEYLKEQKKKKDEIALEVGIGVHTGLVVAGNMGAETRLNYTVLGSNVNLAARLCQVAKANQLLISEHTLEEENVKDSFEVKAMEPIKLKGFVEPVKVYEVIGFSWNK